MDNYILAMAPIPEPVRSLDARGLRCPLPLVKARNEIELVEPGEVLEVLATDPGGAEHDLAPGAAAPATSSLSAEALEGPVYRFLVSRRA